VRRQSDVGLGFQFAEKLIRAEARDAGQIQFPLCKSRGESPLVTGNVQEKAFPERKVMHQGAKVTVQGTRKNFNSHVVYLDEVVVTGYTAEPSPNKAPEATRYPARASAPSIDRR